LTPPKSCDQIAGMYSTAELVVLAQAYIAWADISISRMGELAANNDKLFHRLFAGLDCYASSAERASRWFHENWPDQLPWPPGIRSRACRRRVSKAAAGRAVNA
jgi:hypothetical protein